jgi:hypothetical protein
VTAALITMESHLLIVFQIEQDRLCWVTSALITFGATSFQLVSKSRKIGAAKEPVGCDDQPAHVVNLHHVGSKEVMNFMFLSV